MESPRSPLASTPSKSPPATSHSPPTPPPIRPDDPQSLKAFLTNATDKALEFLSNATNEQLGACLAGLGATTYFIFGRVGLVLIGIVGGVVLHATWESNNGDGAYGEARLKELARRKEVGIDVARRVLDWRDSRRLPETSSDDERDPLGIGISSQNKVADFSAFRSETAAALNEFTDAVIRDYVK